MASSHPFRGDGSRTSSEQEFLEALAAYVASPGVVRTDAAEAIAHFVNDETVEQVASAAVMQAVARL